MLPCLAPELFTFKIQVVLKFWKGGRSESVKMTWEYNTTQHNTTQHNTTQHNTTQHNTTQHNTTQHNTTHGQKHSNFQFTVSVFQLQYFSAKGWQPCHCRVPIVLKSGSLNLLEPSGPVKACNGTALPFTFISLSMHVYFFTFNYKWKSTTYFSVHLITSSDGRWEMKSYST
jgi:hypothetical protein